jgi:L-ascorbate metabolism protein UlaG (beta-lactamase superfamily)
VLREAAYDRLFPRWRPPREHRPIERSQSSSLRIEWLGTAGHVVRTAATTILIDPYVTRAPLSRLVRRIPPDEIAIERWIPKKVDAVLCGHSHFDHLLDAPHIALRRGAKLVGSRTTCSFARAAGVPDENLVEVPSRGAHVRIGDIAVRFVSSLHARIALGRVPFAGEVMEPPHLPARAWDYKMGGAFGILLEAAGVCLYHNGSADLVDAELAGLRADVVLMGLAGRQVRRGYVGRFLDALSPRVVIPTHHDAFFAPLEDGLRLLPGVDLEGWVREVSPRARVILPDYGETVQIAQGAQGASIALGA